MGRPSGHQSCCQLGCDCLWSGKRHQARHVLTKSSYYGVRRRGLPPRYQYCAWKDLRPSQTWHSRYARARLSALSIRFQDLRPGVQAANGQGWPPFPTAQSFAHRRKRDHETRCTLQFAAARSTEGSPCMVARHLFRCLLLIVPFRPALNCVVCRGKKSSSQSR